MASSETFAEGNGHSVNHTEEFANVVSAKGDGGCAGSDFLAPNVQH